MRVRATRATRARLGCGVAFVTALAVFLVVTVISALLFVLEPGGNSASASFIHAQPGASSWDGRQSFTILLLYEDRARPVETDALAVASYNPGTQTLNLLSIPGNLWVTIPGYGPGTISAAYGDGGIHLALRVVESVLRIPIPYYAVMNADVFGQTVDGLGGIDLPAARGQVRHLNGPAALRYLNIGAPSQGDGTATMRREQTLLLAVERRALQPTTFFRIAALVGTLGGNVPTNFPYDKVPVLAHMLLNHTSIHVQMLSGANGAASPYGQNGEQVLMPDWQRSSSIARSMFPDGELGSAKVEVLNGSGVAGQAAALSSWLRQSGLRVIGYDSAPSFGYAHTEVLVAPKAGAEAEHVAQSIGMLLQVPVVTGHLSNQQAPVGVIIGQDYQDPTQG